MSLTSANRDMRLLHPLMRTKVEAVLAELQRRDLPLRVFEGWRSPQRQRYLYAQGRTRPGDIVTYSQAWESYHQYGLAADFVGYVGGWTWDLPPSTWTALHRIGEEQGLEPLGFEKPHLQLADLSIGVLMEGDLPDGGDASWLDNLSDAAAGWDGQPAAPVLTASEPPRPAVARFATALDWRVTPQPAVDGWHSFNDGREWRHDADGIHVRGEPSGPLRSPGVPTTVLAILRLYGADIVKAALDYEIPPEIIVMTIATETAFARSSNFTGPRTFRWEPLVKVRDVDNPTFGDYSAGPMQTLATTAREVIRRTPLPAYPDPFEIAPYYAARPNPAPAQHPLYNGAPNIDIGTAEIKARLGRTGLDPILIAAVYNAGGLYASNRNEWRLRSTGDHLDRAAQWYGDACFVIASLR